MKYGYIIINSRKSSRIREVGGEGKELLKIINRYPIIGELLGQSYVPLTIKPILTRMGKGKGKRIGIYKPISYNDNVIQLYIPIEKIKYILYRMKKEGIYNKNSLIQVSIYIV